MQKVIILGLLIFLVGCGDNKNLEPPKVKKDIQKKVIKKTQKEIIKPKVIFNCSKHKNELLKLKKEYFSSLEKKKISIKDSIILYDSLIGKSLILKENNCNVNIGFDTNKVKIFIADKFIENNLNKYKSYRHSSNILISDLFLLHKENLLEISSKYSEKMNSISIFTTDEENWDLHLETPLRKEIANLNNEFLYEVDNLRIKLLVDLYNSFVNSSDKNNFGFIKINNPEYNTKINTNYGFDIAFDKSDEDVVTSTLVNVVVEGGELVLGDGIASTVIDGVDLAAGIMDIKIRGKKNFQKANNYIKLVMIDFQKTKEKEVNEDIKVQKEYMKKYFRDMIILEEAK